MNARAIVVVGAAALITAGLGGARALAVSATPVSQLRVEWETVPRGDRVVVRGYVYNEYQMRAENVRLRIEQLDASAHPVATRVTWIPGTIPYRDRGYFEAAVPAGGAAYRVSVESFDRSGCGDG
jgi:hypothetical protein